MYRSFRLDIGLCVSVKTPLEEFSFLLMENWVGVWKMSGNWSREYTPDRVIAPLPTSGYNKPSV